MHLVGEYQSKTKKQWDKQMEEYLPSRVKVKQGKWQCAAKDDVVFKTKKTYT